MRYKPVVLRVPLLVVDPIEYTEQIRLPRL